MSLQLINPQLDLKWLASHTTGQGIEVAVIDSGIDARHPDLAGRISRGCVVAKDSKGRIQVREIKGKDCTDNYGHGTAVAGIIADLAPDARMVAVKILNEFNSCTGDILVEGMKWALDRKIRLLNMSLATSKPDYIPSLY